MLLFQCSRINKITRQPPATILFDQRKILHPVAAFKMCFITQDEDMSFQRPAGILLLGGRMKRARFTFPSFVRKVLNTSFD